MRYWRVFAKILHKVPKWRFLVEIACHFAGKQSYARVFLQNFEQIPSDVSENNLEGLVSVIKII